MSPIDIVVEALLGLFGAVLFAYFVKVFVIVIHGFRCLVAIRKYNEWVMHKSSFILAELIYPSVVMDFPINAWRPDIGWLARDIVPKYVYDKIEPFMRRKHGKLSK
jgi:hypothetical protein